PVALDVRQAEERDEREILLDREPRLDGEVLAGHEVVAAPLGAARGVDDGLVEALAGLGRNAPVAQRLGARKGVERIVGLVDDHWFFPAERRNISGQGILALDRLLDERDARHEALKARRRGHAMPELQHAFDVLVLLIAVEARAIVLWNAIAHR